MSKKAKTKSEEPNARPDPAGEEEQERAIDSSEYLRLPDVEPSGAARFDEANFDSARWAP